MGYNIPLFDLNYGKEEIEAAKNTIESGWLSMGPKTEEMEQLICNMLGVKYAIGVTNCTSALHLACILCGFHEGDEVLVPSNTFVASVNCVRYCGATPVFCDVCSINNINIDPEEIENKITEKTKGIVVVHMGGFPADMDRIISIAKKYKLKVIEDACHGPLSDAYGQYNGRKIGTIGDIGCFSFFSNKNISTGEGGVLVTNSDEYNDKARLYRSHGMTTLSYQRAQGHATSYDVVELGYNYRIDDIRASIAIEQLKKLEKDLIKREKVREEYIKNLSEYEDVIRIPFKEYKGFVSNYIMPTVILGGDYQIRDMIRNMMKEVGIQTSVHYPAIHQFSIYKKENVNLPNTDYLSSHEITLPMYSRLTEDQIAYICHNYGEIVRKCL